MAFDYATTQAQAAVLLAEFGVQVTITRGSSSIGRCKGVFIDKKESTWKQPASSVLANTTSTTRQILLPGILKNAPQVGDLITTENTSYQITEIEAIRPALTTILYKVSIS